jgi:hypothetical protein
MTDEIEIDLTFNPKDQSEAQEARSVLEAHGARRVRQIRGYGVLAEGLTLLAITSLTVLVNAVIRLSQLWDESVVVDTRGSKVQITRTASKGGKKIIVKEASDEVIVERPEKMLLPLLMKATRKPRE